MQFFNLNPYAISGKPEEKGHYGLWTLCSAKGPHWREDCDPLDTFFESPPYVTVSGFLCVFNLLLLVIFVPLGFLKILQVCKNKTNFCIKSKKLRIVTVTLALSSSKYYVHFLIQSCEFTSNSCNRLF